ncbi:hypothetical protein [Roseateles koreensis]|uniref:Uncharacterized protein n=1 Tax=Roseateles koreensis TaxID=2987526 RepID=A0ABT5KTQ1_9BURK|nr:hypothetical protein [Roseateles koreensis]MDC8786311.1 hypothetical protein [Roseateles koreensis]
MKKNLATRSSSPLRNAVARTLQYLMKRRAAKGPVERLDAALADLTNAKTQARHHSPKAQSHLETRTASTGNTGGEVLQNLLDQLSDENRHDLLLDERSATSSRDGEGSVLEPANFEPTERQRKVIKQAIEEGAKANRSGGHPPDELVARMTAEGSLTENLQTSDHASVEFRFVLAAAVNEPLTGGNLEERLDAPTCISAAVFRAPRHVMLLEFSQQATTLDAAMTNAVEKVLRAFPQADFVDLNDQDALLCELVEVRDGRSPTETELQRMRHSRVPSNDTLALAAATLDAFSTIGVGGDLHDHERVTEADVFELLPGFGLVHLMTDGGTILSLTARTPGIASLQTVTEGQRYRCWVRRKFDVVVRAELISGGQASETSAERVSP